MLTHNIFNEKIYSPSKIKTVRKVEVFNFSISNAYLKRKLYSHICFCIQSVVLSRLGQSVKENLASHRYCWKKRGML